MSLLKMITGGVMLMAGGVQLFTMYQVNSVASSVYEAQMGDTRDPLKGRYSIDGDIKDRSRYSSEYLALVKPQVLSNKRTIVISAYAPIREVLKQHPDIDSRDEITLQVVSQVWLRNYAKQECKRVLSTIADQCVVKHARAKVVKKGKYINAYILLYFTGKNLAFNLDEKQQYTFGEHSVKLSKRRVTNNYSWKTAQKDRLKHYRKAGKICKKVARKSALCGITGMRLTSAHKARASIAWLQPSR